MLPRSLAVTLFLVMNITAADLTVDHVTVAGMDLHKLQAVFADAGLPTEYGGKHPNRTTEMSLASFADGSYLELIAKQPDADPKAFAAHPWAKLIEANVGPCAWAIRSSEVAEDLRWLANAGIHTGGVETSGRARPDGLQIRWQTGQIGERRGAFFPFLIQDLTPRANRATLHGKPSAPQFTGVSKVIIAVRGLDDAIAQYRKAFALGPPQRRTDADFGAALAEFAGTPVVLASPSGRNWLAERLDKYGEMPCAFVIRRQSAGKLTWLKLDGIGGRIGIE